MRRFARNATKRFMWGISIFLLLYLIESAAHNAHQTQTRAVRPDAPIAGVVVANECQGCATTSCASALELACCATVSSKIDACCVTLNSKIDALTNIDVVTQALVISLFGSVNILNNVVADEFSGTFTALNACCTTLNSKIDNLTGLVFNDFGGTFTIIGNVYDAGVQIAGGVTPFAGSTVPFTRGAQVDAANLDVIQWLKTLYKMIAVMNVPFGPTATSDYMQQ